MTDIYSIIRKDKPDLKKITIDRYVSNLNKLKNDFGGDDKFTFLRSNDKVIKFLEKHPSDSTKKNYLNAIIVFLKASGKDNVGKLLESYGALRDRLNKEYFQAKSTNKTNDKEKEKMISLQEWDNLIDELRKNITANKLRTKQNLGKNEFDKILFHLILTLYRDIPMRNDYASMMVVNNATGLKKMMKDYPDNNFIMIGKNPKFVLTNYKTNKTYGIKEEKVSPHVLRVVKAFLKVSKNPQYLLSDHLGNPFTHNRLGKYITRNFKQYTGKAVGTTTLRKIYLSGKYGKVLEEMKEDSEKMAHSMDTQKLYIKSDADK